MTNVLSFPGEGPGEAERDDTLFTGPAPTIDPNRLTYTVTEVAYLLNLSRGLAYQHVRDGIIPAERIGRRWVVPRGRFHAWLDGPARREGA
ncbi:MAG: helix-turn-helix domain-containing protein [Pseudonocardiaceae bacterium]